MGELTASDVLAMTRRNEDGIFGGNGLIILILFFLLFGMNGIGGNGAAAQGAMTRAELHDGLNTQTITREINDLSMQVCNGFGSVNQNIMSGVNGIQQSMCSGFNSVNQNINQLGFNMQQCCCDLKTAMHAEGEATRSLIQQNEIQALRTALQDEKTERLVTGLVTAQTIQTNTLENFMRGLISGCGCNS